MRNNVFTFNCPHCNSELQAKAAWSGRTMPCPVCSKEFIVPSNSTASSASYEEKTTASSISFSDSKIFNVVLCLIELVILAGCYCDCYDKINSTSNIVERGLFALALHTKMTIYAICAWASVVFHIFVGVMLRGLERMSESAFDQTGEILKVLQNMDKEN